MEFAHGIIGIVAILAGFSLAMIAASPGEVIGTRSDTFFTGGFTMDSMIGGQTGDGMLPNTMVQDILANERGGMAQDSMMEQYPDSITVSIPEGSSLPGCEDTDECYTPYEANVAVGATVTWRNDDTIFHTVTSGTVDGGQDGLFDSGILEAGATFEHTFEGAGNYDYYCIVHPWMAGVVNVYDAMVAGGTAPGAGAAAKPPTSLGISVAQGSGVPGCESTNECYLPGAATIGTGGTITWTNDDAAAHTVTSGNVKDGQDGEFDSGLFLAGDTFEYTFEKAGDYGYFCIVHPWMTGLVSVVDDTQDAMQGMTQGMVDGMTDGMMDGTMQGEAATQPVLGGTAGQSIAERQEGKEPGTFEIIMTRISSSLSCRDIADCYTPQVAYVPVGTVVTWINEDVGIHSVTSNNAVAFLGDVFDSGLMDQGDTYVHRFKIPGSNDYYCIVHPWMFGKIVVDATLDQPYWEEPKTPDEQGGQEQQVAPDVDDTDKVKVSITDASSSIDCKKNKECYVPHDLVVPAGTTVLWTNDDVAIHSVTSTSVIIFGESFDSDLMDVGETFEYTFESPGEYAYTCIVHPWMSAMVTVT